MKQFLIAHYEKIILAVLLVVFAALLYNQLIFVRTAQLEYVAKQTDSKTPDPDYTEIDFAKDKSYKMETVFSESNSTSAASQSKSFGNKFKKHPFGVRTHMMAPYPMAECVHCHALIPVDSYPDIDAEEDGICPACGDPLKPRVKSEKLQPEEDMNFNGIPDEWEKKFELTETDVSSDQDGDGFTLKDEFAAQTDPTDPLSHPKYISYIYVDNATQPRFPGLQLASVNMNKPDKKDWDITFSSQVVSGSSVTKKSPIVRIGRQLKNIDSKKKNVDFEVVDIEMDEKTQQPVVYLQRIGKLDERIPCREGQTVFDPQQKVRFRSALPLWTWSATCDSGAEFKLGTEKTGEERYKFVSVDLKTKEAVVETLDETPETFTVLPAAAEDTAASNAGAADAGTVPPGTVPPGTVTKPASGNSGRRTNSNRQR